MPRYTSFVTIVTRIFLRMVKVEIEEVWTCYENREEIEIDDQSEALPMISN